MDIQLRVATHADLDRLLELVAAYHDFEGIGHRPGAAAAVLRPLLGASGTGRIYLLEAGAEVIGYLALCFGYSIEFGGRDAFLDEMFIVPGHRGRGYGRAALSALRDEAAALGLRALSLEVARDNDAARALYRSAGFAPRERYVLMTAMLDDRDKGPHKPDTT